MKEVKIKSYKGFNQDMTCRGFQYEVGKEYKTSKAECCQQGFHGCESPLEVLGYYFLDDECRLTRFAEVEQSGKLSREDGSTKVASTKIKINAELNLAGLIKAGVEWIKEKSALGKDEEDKDKDSAQIGSSGYSAQIGSSGDHAKIGSSGDSAQIGSSGDYAKIGSSGDSAQIGSSGDHAQIGSSGYYAKIGSSGDYAQIGSSGYSAQIGSSGYSAQIGSSGDSAQIGSSGEDSVIMCAGIESRVKAKKGSWITLAEWKYDKDKKRNIPVCVKTEYVDGERIKADTWYMLNGGEFAEC